MGEGDDSLTDGELVWPVAAVHARRRLLGHRRLRLPGHRAAAAGRPLPVRRLLLRRPVVAEGRAGGPRGRRPARARRACRSSPTSGPTPTASRCSPPRPARSTARSVRDGRDRPVDPDPHAVAGVPGREAEPAAAQAQAARQLELHELVVAVERARDDQRLGVRLAAGPEPIATDSGRITTWTSPASSGGTPKRPSSQSTTPSCAVPGSTSASPRNSASQRLPGRS